jgi:hypothetical protein
MHNQLFNANESADFIVSLLRQFYLGKMRGAEAGNNRLQVMTDINYKIVFLITSGSLMLFSVKAAKDNPITTLFSVEY